MKKLYETTMTNKGGRNGEVFSQDHSLEFKVSAPGTKGEGTNPEQLFAAGYSSCFNSALEMILSQAGKKVDSTIDCTVSLLNEAKTGLQLEVLLVGEIEGFTSEETSEWMKKAHEVCPYSKATQGNIEVILKAK
ncbi:organic hydroperoxide resistance protein [Latilactobacillus fuchuensis]|uniref:organic hydroperoxide resistance protein n=1 Tax=Latilactobacillus fuchuensis TaxID=164393 RepID=UPI00046996B9|nr:organic hydroperoxide resistance protein [Latilactobacillus fuchuensis]